MKKTIRRLLSLALALCVVFSCTSLALPAQNSLAGPKPAAAATGDKAAQITAAGVKAPAALKDAVSSNASPQSAAQSAGIKEIADKVAADAQSKSAVQEVIDGIVAPFKYIKMVNSADDLNLMLKKVLVQSVGGFTDALIKTILKVFPPRDFVNYKDYETKNFLTGTKTYQTSAAPGAKWSAGYQSYSIVPDDVLTSPYYTAGYFNNYTGSKPVTKVLDDQCIRAIALNDGSGNGTAVFLSLDGFAFTNTNARALRARLTDFIAANNIVSINVTTTHSHYCIDTSGLGVSLLPFVGQNMLNDLMGKKEEVSAVNKKFLDGLLTKGAQAVKDAVNSMKPGKLYYRASDIGDLINDKQTPIVYDHNANTIRFVPDSKSAAEIWLVNAGIHPTGYDRNSTEVSAEFPYAIVKYAKELAGADVAFYQGSQEEISKGGTIEMPETWTPFDYIQAYGKEIVKRIMTPASEVQIEPYMNVTHAEIFMPFTNPILEAAAKLQIINSTCVNTTGRLEDALLVTELGYCELGSKLAIALVPGEMAPEIAWGCAKTAADSWNGTDWTYPSMQELAGRKLIVFGLTNDEIGYIIPDNDVATTLADTFGQMMGESPFGAGNKHYAEMLTLGPNTASLLMDYYTAMLEDFKG